MVKIRDLKKDIKQGIDEVNKVHQCPYCNKRLEEIKEHRRSGHKTEPQQ